VGVHDEMDEGGDNFYGAQRVNCADLLYIGEGREGAGGGLFIVGEEFGSFFNCPFYYLKLIQINQLWFNNIRDARIP